MGIIGAGFTPAMGAGTGMKCTFRGVEGETAFDYFTAHVFSGGA